MPLERVYVQVYTGDGKGKTTAALGLALRAAGAGLKVYIAQFAKGIEYSELKSLALLRESIEIHQYGLRCFITDRPSPEDVEAARRGLEEVREAIRSKRFDLIILDEANIATWFGLITVDELLDVIELAGQRSEVVITGRKADPKIMEWADLVTEMREIKHYYSQGVQARIGIES